MLSCADNPAPAVDFSIDLPPVQSPDATSDLSKPTVRDLSTVLVANPLCKLPKNRGTACENGVRAVSVCFIDLFCLQNHFRTYPV